MTELPLTERDVATRATTGPIRPRMIRRRRTLPILVGAAIIGVIAVVAVRHWQTAPTASAPPPPPQVTVSTPLQATVSSTTGFLGQFSAVDMVELRAQVGGTLAAISFQDGQIVHRGDPLFAIDDRPFRIKLEQAVAQLQTAQAREALSEAELWRAQQLKRTEFGTAENVDQRAAEQRSAQAAIAAGAAAVKDAELDLEFSRIAAPFTGRIGAHQVSVGSLVSGSRGGASQTTLLATVVSLDPIHLDFDMSEADFLAYQNAHLDAAQPADVAVTLEGSGHPLRHGKLDFIDNAVNRSSGTIHARATLANPDLAITPGQFARLRVGTGRPGPVLLLPPTAIVPDQSRQLVMTVAGDGAVVPKTVEIGDLYRGLRVVRSGLAPTDTVIINGLVRVRPGAKVTPVAGTIAAAPERDGP